MTLNSVEIGLNPKLLFMDELNFSRCHRLGCPGKLTPESGMQEVYLGVLLGWPPRERKDRTDAGLGWERGYVSMPSQESFSRLPGALKLG